MQNVSYLRLFRYPSTNTTTITVLTTGDYLRKLLFTRGVPSPRLFPPSRLTPLGRCPYGDSWRSAVRPAIHSREPILMGHHHLIICTGYSRAGFSPDPISTTEPFYTLNRTKERKLNYLKPTVSMPFLTFF
jgi:hypothetical protein